jgi:hypothetical protein
MRKLALLITLSLVCGSLAPPGAAKANYKTAGPKTWAGDLTAITKADWSYERAGHLLERAGFGGTPEEIERLAKMTPQAAVNFIIH